MCVCVYVCMCVYGVGLWVCVGAKAMQTANLKSITGSHLALASRALALIASQIPTLRAGNLSLSFYIYIHIHPLSLSLSLYHRTEHRCLSIYCPYINIIIIIMIN